MTAWLLRCRLALILLTPACGPTPECRANAQAIRAKIAAIDWSVGVFAPEFPYTRVPAAPGQVVPATRLHTSILTIDGERIHFGETYSGRGTSLHAWLTARAPQSMWMILHQGLSQDQNAALRVVATEHTRLGTVRTVGAALRPFGVVHLGVRPEGPPPAPWKPSARLKQEFEDAFRLRPGEGRLNDREMAFGLVPAGTCFAARNLVKAVGLHSDQRLKRVPEVFEDCNCRGDMQTLAAFFARQALEDLKPIRWFDWDDELLEQLGDDATYGDLARALAARSRRRPQAAATEPASDAGAKRR